MARGRYIVMADADDSYNFADIPRFVEKLREGNDLVMGNRFRGGIEKGAMPPLHRYFGNPVLSAIGRILFPSPLGDFHCGMRGFSREAVLGLDLRTTGMEFASEMVVKATIHRLRIAEIPTTLKRDGRSHPPHLRSWRDGWRHLRFMLLMSPRSVFLYPGLLLFGLGIAGMLWLEPGPRIIGGTRLDISTLLLAAAAALIGAQGILFWTFAKTYAIEARLLPKDPRLDRLLRVITLEAGVVVGGLTFLAGFALALFAVYRWESVSFGDLDPGRTMRVVIPAMLLMVLGVEGVLGTFLLGVLRLRQR